MQVFSNREICPKHLTSLDSSCVAKGLSEFTDMGLAVSCGLPDTPLFSTAKGRFFFLLVIHLHF